MYLSRIKMSSDQLEMMIASIRLEYTYNSEDELADLLANNYNLDYIEVVATLRAYNACKEEDFTVASDKVMFYG